MLTWYFIIVSSLFCKHHKNENTVRRSLIRHACVLHYLTLDSETKSAPPLNLCSTQDLMCVHIRGNLLRESSSASRCPIASQINRRDPSL